MWLRKVPALPKRLRSANSVRGCPFLSGDDQRAGEHLRRLHLHLLGRDPGVAELCLQGGLLEQPRGHLHRRAVDAGHDPRGAVDGADHHREGQHRQQRPPPESGEDAIEVERGEDGVPGRPVTGLGAGEPGVEGLRRLLDIQGACMISVPASTPVAASEMSSMAKRTEHSSRHRRSKTSPRKAAPERSWGRRGRAYRGGAVGAGVVGESSPGTARGSRPAICLSPDLHARSRPPPRGQAPKGASGHQKRRSPGTLGHPGVLSSRRPCALL